MSYTIETLEEDTAASLGRVTDLMIGLNTGEVKYALVSTGEETTDDQTLIPIPFYAFAPDPGRLTLVTTLEQETLANAPRLDPNNWPDTTVSDWEVEIRDYWAGSGLEIVQPIPNRGVTTIPIDEPTRRASELLGAEVNLSQQNSSARIEDLIVGLTSQYVNYAVLSLEQGLVPVFFPALDVDEQGTLVLDVEPQVLAEIPTLEADNWPEAIIAPGWDVVYRNYWIGFGMGAGIASIEASDLLDRDVINLQGQGLGEIEDVLIDLDSGQVPYAILGSGGFLGLGEELLPVPLSELSLDPFRQVMILNITEEALENAPRFESENWPDMTQPDWLNDYQAFWAEQLLDSQDEADNAGQPTPGTMVRASTLLDYNVQNLQNEELGELEDLIINFTEEQVDYAVLSVGGFLGIGAKLVAVPLDKLTFDAEQQLLALDADQQTLEEAPGVEDIDLLALTDPDWDAEIQSYWEN
jgi:sporulation protein YlmC with PRC-barrel domain